MLLVSTARISFFGYGSAVISSTKMAIFYPTTEVVDEVKNNPV
jgi:hypothetical protein